jgi:hypothetical protein
MKNCARSNRSAPARVTIAIFRQSRQGEVLREGNGILNLCAEWAAFGRFPCHHMADRIDLSTPLV